MVELVDDDDLEASGGIRSSGTRDRASTEPKT
jgi:hypothetical protein